MPPSLEIYADAVLLMASLGAALYCLKLQRSLSKIQKLDRGFGEAIGKLTIAVRASQQASQDIRVQIEEAMRTLDERVGHLSVQRAEVDDLLDVLDGQVAHQTGRVDEARQVTEKALTPLLERAELDIHTLTKAIEVSARLSSLMRAKGEAPAQREPAPGKIRPLAEEDLNPFLKAVGA